MSKLTALLRFASRRMLLSTVFNLPLIAALFAGCGGTTESAAPLREAPAVAAAAAAALPAAHDNGLDISVDCCGPQAVDVAVGITWGLQLAHDLPNDVPVRVSGPAGAPVADVAAALTAGGLSEVRIVATPGG